MSFKKCKVSMFPTEGKSPLWKTKGHDKYSPSGTLTMWGNTPHNPKLGSNQHIYITSDDKVEEGDYFVAFEGNIPRYVEKADYDRTNIWAVEMTKGCCKKIIATTDTSIGWINGNHIVREFPQPSKSFLKKFVQEFNNENFITEVLVEYKEIPFSYKGAIGYTEKQYTLKIDDSDNTITIMRLRENFSRGEMVKIVYDVLRATGKEIKAEMKNIQSGNPHIEFSGDDVALWLENYL
jgi:hypothetical protein